MSNLKKQMAAIKQQLATSTAETLVRFKKVESDLASGFQELRQAIQDQSMVQQAALDRLIELVVEHSEAHEATTERRLEAFEERLTRLEGKLPAA